MKSRLAWRAISSLIVLLFAGCIPSLQPLFTEKDLVFEETLLGSFSEEKQDPSTWTFSRGEDRGYHLVIKDGNKRSPLSAHLFKVDGKLYLDLYPENEGFEDWPRDDFFKSTLVPAHIFFAVSDISPILRFRALQEDWLKEYLQKTPNAVPHTLVENSRLVFTGTTEQMQSFLKKAAGEKGAWSEPAELHKRPGTAATK
ncbi:MAG TPA: hypothetical protein VGR78_18420 [Verrucomicrobiae bacterium]|jgi:hypothetical protein|nr:hypothetical protein [Verrucomicrobiae bacterium]